MTDDEPRSPCISVCLLDEENVCVGCYRSADEITDWFMADSESRREILQRVRARREADSRIKLG
jgi:predicted Fe-S protein YdhL (DUF1289 family)